jgi:dethiobiotin synthetase
VKAVFVTGTDTGVGKTRAALALIAGWRAAGLRVGVMKPCETGCEEKAEGGAGLVPADAVALLDASGSELSLDEVCPFRFRTPMAPAEAAALEDGAFSIERAVEVFESIRGRHDVTLVEGAGGLIVPFEGERTTVDLVRAMDIPVVVVARIGLGTINHTCLTVDRARFEGLDVLGVIFNRCEDPRAHPPGPDEERNPAAVERLCGVKVLGSVAFDPEGVSPFFLDLGFEGGKR